MAHKYYNPPEIKKKLLKSLLNL